MCANGKRERTGRYLTIGAANLDRACGQIVGSVAVVDRI
jgi:hypothetical protein